MLRTPFTDLVGCSVPIQQAGMGGIATPKLACSVAQAGGLGMVAGVMVPAEVLAGMLDAIDERTRRAVGVNFLMPFLDESAVKAASSRARVVEFFYDDPRRDLVDLVHSGGALAFWQVGSVEEAVAAAEAGCDAVIAQGTEAGGHVRGKVGLLALLSEVLDEVQVPVIAAGGIGNSAAMAAALAAGASAVRVGTRFVAARESDAHPDYTKALIGARAADTVLTEAYSVMWPDAPHRVLRSGIELSRTLPDDQPVGEVTIGEEQTPIARFSVEPPTVDTTGNIAAMALYAGESVDSVRGVQPAAEIVRELSDGAEALLRRFC